MRERIIPPAAVRDPNSREVLRVWVAEHGLHCSLEVGVYEKNGPFPEDKAWGIILADAAKHIADALSKSGLRERSAALAEVRRSFVDELDDPTSQTEGGFVQ